MSKNYERNRGNQKHSILRLLIIFLFIFQIGFAAIPHAKAATAITLTKGSWDIIGLDSNKPGPPDNEGPDYFLIQIHITDTLDGEDAQGVSATLSWTSSNSYINLHTNEAATKNLGDITDGGKKDVFYLVQVTRDTNAWFTSKNYSIVVTGTNFPTQTITGTLYVEKLVSQNRNYIISIDPSSSNPAVGEIFTLTVESYTATTYDYVTIPLVGYDPAIVEPLSVSTTPPTPATDNLLLTNTGGYVMTSTWTLLAKSVGITYIGPFIYDFSGSSYHYNGDYGEDQAIITVSELDFGDLPDSPYPTLLSSNGARHKINSTIRLGSYIDAEHDGQPDVNALGDDSNPVGSPDDEDGVIFITPIIPGGNAVVQVNALIPTGGAYLNAWMDFNNDGDFTDTGEQIISNYSTLGTGTNYITFAVPSSTIATTLYSRFRLSTQASLSYTGLANDGEVEDYKMNTYSISGHKYDTSDNGLSGWEIYIDTNDNGQWDTGEPKTTTGTDGSYSFTGLLAGTYRIREVLKSEWSIVSPASGYYDVTVGPNATDKDFVNSQNTYSISGHKYDTSDNGLSGWEIYIDTNDNGQWDTGEPKTTTGTDGSYSFTGLLAGTYRIREVLKSEWSIVSPASGYYDVTVGPNATDKDFVNSQNTYSISGHKYDTSDNGLSGWEIYIDTNDNGQWDTGEPKTTTGTDGSYSFTGLLAGTYRIREVLKSEWSIVSPASGYYDVTVGPNATDKDFVNSQNTYSISGHKYDTSDNGLSGWEIYIDTNDNGQWDTGEPKTTTGTDGSYSFTGLLAGTYRIREVLKSEWSIVSPASGYYDVTVGPNATDKDFVNSQNTYSICGYKWSDLDNDGTWDAGEPGLSGWTIELRNAAGALLASTTTGESGSYCFTGLLPGTYYVNEVEKAGWTKTYPTGSSHEVTITNANVNDINFGNHQNTYSISGYKWNDLDHDGIWDGGEPGLSGWTIQLYNATDLVATTTTGMGGAYSFTNLSPATYDIYEVTQIGWLQTYPTSPNNYHTVTITNTNIVNINFGNFYPNPILNIVKSDNPDPVQVGGTLIYTIEYWNSGNADAHNVVITETYDANVTFVSATPAPTSGNNVWSIGTLSPTTHYTITITVSVNAALANGTILTNLVSIDSDETTPVSDIETTTVISTTPSLVVSKTPDTQTLVLGSNITWTIVATNNGTATLTNVTIVDNLPIYLFYLGTNSITLTGTGTRTSIVNPTYGSMGTITWGTWTLNPGATLSITFTVTTVAGAPQGTYTNRAYVTSNEYTTPQDNAVVNLYEPYIPPPPPPPTPPPTPPTPPPAPPEIPEVEFIKEGPAQAYWGETVTYTIKLSNIGGNATNVVIYDYLPPHAEFVDASPVYSYDEASKTITWKYDEIESGDVKELWIKAVLKGECGGIATNRATVNADYLGEILKSEVDTKVICIEVYHQNFFSGYPDKNYKPERPVSRAEVASSLGRALGLPYLEFGSDVLIQSFPDVSPQFWAFGNIEAVVKEKLVVGYPNGTYRPNRFITRAEVAAIFFRLLNLEPIYPSKPTFKDVSSTHWAYGMIEAIAKKGIILGYPDGTFKPDQNITRAEYVTIACKSLFRRGPFKDGVINNPYPDIDANHWAYDYIMEASIPHVVVNPARLENLIIIPSKKIPLYVERSYSEIVIPGLGSKIIAIVPVDGLDENGNDPKEREVIVRIIVKGGLP